MFDFGILGINARNLQYVGKHNPAKGVRLADNKITTKNFLSERGIPVPLTYASISSRAELNAFDFSEIPHTHFVMKPARGSRGRGVYRVKKIKDYQGEQSSFLHSRSLYDHFFTQHHIIDPVYVEVEGKIINQSVLKRYGMDILEGVHSLGNKPDDILLEELLLPGYGFELFCTHGLADIRLIVYNFVPVAAMLRVPTSISGGKANLDRGGVGFGVEVGSGKIISLYLDKIAYTDHFPAPYEAYHGQIIPYREELLERSSQIQYYVNLGYLALDRVITDKGPKLLEINARAGLKIQLALQLPLRKRLEKISDLIVSSTQKGVEICQTLFTHQPSGLISPKKILPQSGIGVVQLCYDTTVTTYDVTITINLTMSGWKLGRNLALQASTISHLVLSYSTGIETFSTKQWVVDQSLEPNHIVIGADVVSGYFVKPMVIEKAYGPFLPEMLHEKEQDTLHLLDKRISQIASKLIFSRHLKPINFVEEFDTFLSLQGVYNPSFIYQRPSEKKLTHIADELSRLQEELAIQLHIESPILPLFIEKIEELKTKRALFIAYRDQNLSVLSELQAQYRGAYDADLLTTAKQRLGEIIQDRHDLGPVLGRKKLKRLVSEYLIMRGWSMIDIVFTPETYARMSVQKKGSTIVVKIASGASFREMELYAALAHELAHLERYVQALGHHREILKRGTARYFIDEEGLAIVASEQELPDAYEKLSMRKKYVLIDLARHHNFAQMASFLQESGQKSLLGIFKSVYRLKRGIIDMQQIHPGTVSLQDSIYAHGYQRITQRKAKGGDLSRLMVGKIKIEDITYLL